jgi:hypothetical protein
LATGLTLEALKRPSKSTSKRPLFATAVNACASAANREVLSDGTVRRYLENYRILPLDESTKM